MSSDPIHLLLILDGIRSWLSIVQSIVSYDFFRHHMFKNQNIQLIRSHRKKQGCHTCGTMKNNFQSTEHHKVNNKKIYADKGRNSLFILNITAMINSLLRFYLEEKEHSSIDIIDYFKEWN